MVGKEASPDSHADHHQREGCGAFVHLMLTAGRLAMGWLHIQGLTR